MNNMKITHESLLENGWEGNEEEGRYTKKDHRDYSDSSFVLFLSRNYGVEDNYKVKLIRTVPDTNCENVEININCMTHADLKALEFVFHKAGAVGIIKRLLINY